MNQPAPKTIIQELFCSRLSAEIHWGPKQSSATSCACTKMSCLGGQRLGGFWIRSKCYSATPRNIHRPCWMVWLEDRQLLRTPSEPRQPRSSKNEMTVCETRGPFFSELIWTNPTCFHLRFLMKRFKNPRPAKKRMRWPTEPPSLAFGVLAWGLNEVSEDVLHAS